MEAPIRPFLTILLSTIFTAFSFTTYFSYVNCILHESDVYTEPSDIFDLVNRHCVVVLFSSEDQRYDDVYLQLETAFHKERDVTLRRVGYAPDQFYWNRNEPLQWMSKPVEIITKSRIGVFKKKKTDRTCLMLPTNGKATKPKAEAYTGPVNAKSILEFINEKCETYRSLSGELSPEGLHRENLLENLFYVSSISNITMQLWANCSKENGGDTCWRSSHSSFIKVNNPDVCPLASDVHKETKQGNLQASTSSKSGKIPDKTTKPKQTLPECERIAIPTWETFFDDYLKHSRPVIIKDAFNHWPAMKKWTTEYLRNKYGKKDVHIKLAPNGHFEGVEKASLWEDFATFNIPNQVKDSLQYPDLVVVRPATMNLNFSAFLDTMTGNSTFDMKGSTGVRVSAYLEYSSIPQYLPELEKDIEFPFVKNKLKRRHLNIWLSDGNTLGKLHFDPFDNFLCQIRGRKELILFEPHDNTKLYEAHIPEALLGFNAETGEFRRKTLMDSTSMVMAPVDIQDPDFKRFPNFAKTHPLNCTIDEGDMLFMPAFWWHEVQSHPNLVEHRNVAVNFWFEPFLTKEFPCPHCHLDVNPYYRHLL